MATTTHTEVPGGGKPQFPPFNKQTFASQLLWLVIAFVLLYLLMSRLALPRVARIIASRSDQIAGHLGEAQKLKDSTDTAIATYEKKLADARNNAQTIAGQTRDKLMAEAEGRRKTLEGELHQKLEAAEKTIAATKTAAMTNVQAIAKDAAAAIVERLTGSPAPDKDVADAVADVLKR